MVETQLEARGIKDQRVLHAMAQVPREEFVTPAWRDAAYADGALPIDCGQTISQPFTVAFMCEAAQISEGSKVLEVGTGSGYGAAVLAQLCREVHTVERIPDTGSSSCWAIRTARLFDGTRPHGKRYPWPAQRSSL